MTQRTALALLASMGPIGWYEAGANGVYDHNTRQYVSGGYYNYQGTATLNLGLSVVPEPRAWTLMILGFAGAGMAVRRRCSMAA